MRVHFGFDNLPTIEHPVVTIGSFDGVHLGHRALLERVQSEAQRIGGRSVVVTFSPHPREVLPRGGGSEFRLLTSTERRLQLLDELGIDDVVVVEFNMQFAALTAEQFVSTLLVDKLGMAALVVGYNHRFGHDRDIPSDHIEQLGCKYGFEVIRAEALTLPNGGKISSSVIRKLIEQGYIHTAEQLLGHKL